MSRAKPVTEKHKVSPSFQNFVDMYGMPAAGLYFKHALFRYLNRIATDPGRKEKPSGPKVKLSTLKGMESVYAAFAAWHADYSAPGLDAHMITYVQEVKKQESLYGKAKVDAMISNERERKREQLIRGNATWSAWFEQLADKTQQQVLSIMKGSDASLPPAETKWDVSGAGIDLVHRPLDYFRAYHGVVALTTSCWNRAFDRHARPHRTPPLTWAPHYGYLMLTKVLRKLWSRGSPFDPAQPGIVDDDKFFEAYINCDKDLGEAHPHLSGVYRELKSKGLEWATDLYRFQFYRIAKLHGREELIERMLAARPQDSEVLFAGQSLREILDSPTLAAAVVTGQVDVVDRLLQEDRSQADSTVILVSMGDGMPTISRPQSMLELAVANRQYLVVSVLLSHGADVNQRCSDGVSLLEKAVLVGEHEAVETLLSYGASPASLKKSEDATSFLCVNELEGAHCDNYDLAESLHSLLVEHSGGGRHSKRSVRFALSGMFKRKPEPKPHADGSATETKSTSPAGEGPGSGVGGEPSVARMSLAKFTTPDAAAKWDIKRLKRLCNTLKGAGILKDTSVVDRLLSVLPVSSRRSFSLFNPFKKSASSEVEARCELERFFIYFPWDSLAPLGLTTDDAQAALRDFVALTAAETGLQAASKLALDVLCPADPAELGGAGLVPTV